MLLLAFVIFLSYEAAEVRMIQAEEDISNYTNKYKIVIARFCISWEPLCNDTAHIFHHCAHNTMHNTDEVAFIEIDALQNYNLTNEYHVYSYPTIIAIAHGNHYHYYGEIVCPCIEHFISKSYYDTFLQISQYEEVLDNKELGYVLVISNGFDWLVRTLSPYFEDILFYHSNHTLIIDMESVEPNTIIYNRNGIKSKYNGDFQEESVKQFIIGNMLSEHKVHAYDESAYSFLNRHAKDVVIWVHDTNEVSQKQNDMLTNIATIKKEYLFLEVTPGYKYSKQMFEICHIRTNHLPLLAFGHRLDSKIITYMLNESTTQSMVIDLIDKFSKGLLKKILISEKIKNQTHEIIKSVVSDNFEVEVIKSGIETLTLFYKEPCEQC